MQVKKSLAFAEIKKRLANPPSDRTLRLDCQHLNNLGPINATGFGRGARWCLAAKNKAK